MPCEDCNKNFTLLRRKKSCSECKRLFCTNCLRRVGHDETYLCDKCIVLTKRPICVSDLQKLKPKDLILYLQSKHISTSGCVEKDELIHLVVVYAANNHQQPHSQQHTTTSAGITDDTNRAQGNGACSNPFDQIRQTCSSLFTNFAEKIATDLHQFQPSMPRAYPAPAPPTVVTAEPPRRTSEPSAGPSGAQQPAAQDGTEVVANGDGNSRGSESSFEEIGAVGGPHGSPESEQWQVLSEALGSSTSNNGNGQKHSIEEEAEDGGARPRRRRSDSDLHGVKSVLKDVLDSLDVEKPRSCETCNVAIKTRISELRLQLDQPNATDEENRRHLDDFLNFLESDNRHSIPHTPVERQHCDEVTAAINSNGVPPTSCSGGGGVGGSTGATPMSTSAAAGTSTVPVDIPMAHATSYNAATYNNDDNNAMSTSAPPKFFDRTQRVTLDDITSIEDFENLSVKQLKQLLALNRVDYKGCCEKEELKERVMRLWRNHKANPIPDKLPADDLCKICMDAPIECIYLECGHLVACLACSKVLSECPVCRQYIARVVRFFRV